MTILALRSKTVYEGKKERGKGERDAHFDCQLSPLELRLVMVKWPINGSGPPKCAATSSSYSSSLSSFPLRGGGLLAVDALTLLVF